MQRSFAMLSLKLVLVLCQVVVVGGCFVRLLDSFAFYLERNQKLLCLKLYACFSSIFQTENLEAKGELAPGSLKDAKKQIRINKYDLLKFVKCLQNAMYHGIGRSLDEFLPVVRPPAQVEQKALEQNATFIFLTDMESQQSLGSCHPTLGFKENSFSVVFSGGKGF